MGVLRPRLHRRFTMLTRKTPAARIACTAAFLVLALALVPAALAGKGGKPGAGGSTTGSSLSPVLVFDPNGNGAANWNDQITFNVATTATTKPWVRLNCYQSGVWVSTSTAGFFAAYAWAPNFTLSSGGWTSGAGDCTATLYMVTSNGRTKNLASYGFHVDS
jgi:hypothetical protein